MLEGCRSGKVKSLLKLLDERIRVESVKEVDVTRRPGQDCNTTSADERR